MGDAKRRRERMGEAATMLGRALADQGKLIEVGWRVFAHAVLPLDCSPQQHDDMQLAFFAGAEHLFSTIIDIMDAGDEPTENDMRRVERIKEEIDKWRGRISERVSPSKGSA